MNFVSGMTHLYMREYLSPTALHFEGEQSLTEEQDSENNSHHLQQTSLIQTKNTQGKHCAEIQQRKCVITTSLIHV